MPWRAGSDPAARGAVRLRAQRRALADGGGARADICSAALLGRLGRRAQGRRSIRSRSPLMEEIGIDIAEHQPMTFEELEDWTVSISI